MTSKIVVNNIEADAGVSTVTFNSNVERGSSNLHSTGLNVNDTFVHSTGIALGAGSTIGAVTGVTTYYGDGSQLTGAGPTLTNGADNRVVTATSASAITGEANLTFSGSELVADSSMITAQNTGAGSGASKIQLQPYGTDGYINCTASGNLYTRMGTGFTTRTQIDSSGNFTVSSGNLVIGTAGKGIDFSINSQASGMTSELLDGYEEGTWTPTAGGFTMGSVTSAAYTRIGRLIFVSCYINTAAGSSGAPLYIGGLPHVVKSGNYYQYACGRIGNASYTNSANDIVFEFTTGSTTVFPKVQDGGMNWGMASNTHIIFSGCYMS